MTFPGLGLIPRSKMKFNLDDSKQDNLVLILKNHYATAATFSLLFNVGLGINGNQKY